jgi:Family of unknown function (DUF6714)
LTSGPIGSLIDDLSHFEHDVRNWPFGVDCAYRYRELLWVFTPEAYRFYLPKFLIAALDPACLGVVTESLIHNLFPPAEDSFQERARFEVRVSLLDGPQADAVGEFLRFVAERDAEEYAFDDEDEAAQNPQRALDRYWLRAKSRSSVDAATD